MLLLTLCVADAKAVSDMDLSRADSKPSEFYCSESDDDDDHDERLSPHDSPSSRTTSKEGGLCIHTHAESPGLSAEQEWALVHHIVLDV